MSEKRHDQGHAAGDKSSSDSSTRDSHLKGTDIHGARHAGAGEMAEAESSRTNASSGSLTPARAGTLSRAERQKIAQGQEESLQIVGAEGTASRHSRLKERDLGADSHVEKIHWQIPFRDSYKGWIPPDGCKDFGKFSDDMSAYATEFYRVNHIENPSPFTNAFRHELAAATMHQYGWDPLLIQGLGVLHEIEGWSCIAAAIALGTTPIATPEQKAIAAKMEKAVGPTWADSLQDLCNNQTGSSISGETWTEVVNNVAAAAGKQFPPAFQKQSK